MSDDHNGEVIDLELFRRGRTAPTKDDGRTSPHRRVGRFDAEPSVRAITQLVKALEANPALQDQLEEILGERLMALVDAASGPARSEQETAAVAAFAEVFGQDTLDSAYGHINAALRLQRSGQPDGAREAADEATRLAPELFEAWYVLGLLEAESGRRDAAQAALERARVLLDAPKITALQAELFRDAHNPDRAESLLDEAVARNPASAEFLRLRAHHHHLSGAVELALHDYDRAVSLDPHDLDNLFNRAAARSELEDYSGAEADLDQLLASRPDDADAHAQRGIVRMLQGRPEEARDDWEAAITVDPWQATARLKHAVLDLDDGRVWPGLVHAVAALVTSEDSWELRGHATKLVDEAQRACRGYTPTIEWADQLDRALEPFYRRQDYEAVARVIDSVAARSAAAHAVARARGVLADSVGLAERALDAFEQAAALQPEDASAQYGLARAALELGRGRLARDAAAVAVRIGVAGTWWELHEARLVLARACGSTGDHDEAVEQLEHVVRKVPTFDVWFSLAYYRGRLGRHAAALEAYDAAIESSAASADAWFGRAGQNAALHRRTDALADLRKALGLDATLRHLAVDDPLFDPLRDDVEFRSLVREEKG